MDDRTQQAAKASVERERALEALQVMLDARLENEGGYPAVVDGYTVRGYVLIADVDHNEAPELAVYRWPDVLRWYRAALRYQAEEEDCEDLAEAMRETQPAGIDLTRAE